MFNIIVAQSRNRGIGMNNKLPWSIPNDMKRFKNLTIGNKNNSVIMGRKTWESIHENHKPLCNRKNIVISRKLDYIAEDVPVFNNLYSAYEYSLRQGYSKNWIIGGGEIYKAALEQLKIDEVYITQIDKEYDCDAFFPSIKDYYFFKLEESREYTEGDVKYKYELHVKNRAYEEELKAIEYYYTIS